MYRGYKRRYLSVAKCVRHHVAAGGDGHQVWRVAVVVVVLQLGVWAGDNTSSE
jgi:hypothetical protein